MLFTCLEIFFARILDVSISTFRTMFMIRKKSLITPCLAFLEVFIWYIAARKALTTEIDNIIIPIFYSLGYATGTYIGSILSQRFIKNVYTVEITTNKNNHELIDTLRDLGYGVSVISLKYNINEDKDLLIVDIKSNNTKQLINTVKKYDSNAFIVVKDTKVVHNGFIK